MEDEGEGEGNKGEGEGIFVLVWDKGLPLDREETDVAHRKMVVYKSKGKPCVRMRCLILIGHVNIR